MFPASAQLGLEGQMRSRAEFRNGYRQMPVPGTGSAGQVAQRTRLSLFHGSDGRVSTRISIQDIRLWGQELQLDHNPSFGLYEAWMELRFADNLSLRAGRQELRYDNQRLMAINDWAPTGRTHDAAVLKYGDGQRQLHVGAAFNQSQDRLFDTHYLLNNYKTLNYIWYHRELQPNTSLSLHFIADGYEHPDDPSRLYVRATWAGYLSHRLGEFELRLYPAYQHGNTRSGQNINAWYLMAEAGRRFAPQLSTILGIEIFSGNDATGPGNRFNAFDDLYGVGHARNGYMDYFTNFPNHTQNAGLVNPYLKGEFVLSDQSSFSAHLHLFFLQNTYVHEGQVIDNYLGTEIDMVFFRRFTETTSIVGGYSVMFGTESMEHIRGGSSEEFAHWAFLMLRLTPRFL